MNWSPSESTVSFRRTSASPPSLQTPAPLHCKMTASSSPLEVFEDCLAILDLDFRVTHLQECDALVLFALFL